MHMLNLADFRATKRECADLGVEFGDASLAGVSGLVYANCCYIENLADGMFHLLVERSDWINHDLAALENILWAEHYLFETESGDLSFANGTLDDFIAGHSAALTRPSAGHDWRGLFGDRECSPHQAFDIMNREFRRAA